MYPFPHPDRFASRHLGPREEDLPTMLQTIGVASFEELIDQTIPAQIRREDLPAVPDAQSEHEYLQELKTIAAKNEVFKNYLGLGYSGTITPGVILRNIFENPGWYTQYTPYQAEIAQGRLEALLNFQTMVCDLTGLPVANASLLDEGTAAGETMHLFYAARNKRGIEANRFFVSKQVFPQTLDVLRTRALPLGIELVVGDWQDFKINASTFGVLLQYPNEQGNVEDFRAFVEAAKAQGAYVAVATDLLALTLLSPPGDWGADVAFGNSQRFGVPMGFGGPHAAFFATKDEFVRLMPGRLIGVSIDSAGEPALRMALQTREQHIRREKATSNICTAQALLAIMASMYAVYHGPKGLKGIAERAHALTRLLDSGLRNLGYEQQNVAYFDTLRIDLKEAGVQAKLHQLAEGQRINLRYVEERFVQISLDETHSLAAVEELLQLFAELKGVAAPTTDSLALGNIIPAALQRSSEYLTHPVFNSYHSEHQMLRYIKRLENKDLSLAHSMISLGSCTMKLNATSEMIPVTWESFGQLHPFAPLSQAKGYLQIFQELEQWLCAATGFSACSLQPNSGAQGEYAGLLTIRAYHQATGGEHRNIALIPQSAHGTNPASAVMAGMEVVVVKCDESGNIDFADLRARAEQYSQRLACLMVTYPSTHGVFETAIREMCSLIHQHGGKVYMDGANMNAQVGLTSPALIGADVCHLNLHKTFAIPHGGGGPGMGPICVNDSLAPYLPGHIFAEVGGNRAISAVSSAPWGSASILLISYGYIKMLGAQGILDATRFAILNANYIKARLEKDYSILYTGEAGRVAHELIVDLRPFKKLGIEAEDIAKRLMDYGFHAPTMSFPVAGTIMIEPTESEDLGELNRFCDALLQIRKEIDEIATGEADAHNNVLHNAPHTMKVITANEWTMPYSRQKAAFPLPFVRERKFWATIGRINNTHGDRNLICTCPPMEAYAETEAAV